MSAITMEVSDKVAAKIRSLANERGMSVENFLHEMAERRAGLFKGEKNPALDAAVRKLKARTQEQAAALLEQLTRENPPERALPPGKTILEILEEHWPRDDDEDTDGTSPPTV